MNTLTPHIQETIFPLYNQTWLRQLEFNQKKTRSIKNIILHFIALTKLTIMIGVKAYLTIPKYRVVIKGFYAKIKTNDFSAIMEDYSNLVDVRVGQQELLKKAQQLPWHARIAMYPYVQLASDIIVYLDAVDAKYAAKGQGTSFKAVAPLDVYRSRPKSHQFSA